MSQKSIQIKQPMSRYDQQTSQI